MKKNLHNWLLAVLLSAPMIYFFMAKLLNHDPSLTPTGFIQYDNVSYVAYARQYLDADRAGLFYNNPFNDAGHYQPIYVQPQTLFFATLLKLGVPPGWILIPFTLLCSVICFRILIAIYDHLFPVKAYRLITLWLFAWGGGLLMITGRLVQFLLPSYGISSPFHFDPGSGWWGLNLGRALFFSCEAWYHLLFLSIILFVLKKHWGKALALAAVLSISHPFTGIELLGILLAWLAGEHFIFRNKSVPRWFTAGLLLVFIFHVLYYLYYLNGFPEHRSVNDQYGLNWNLRFFNMIPAYCIVGFLALFTWIKIRPGKQMFRQPESRLFMAWFIVTFLLVNHELFMKPMQPLHFTRGYVWTSLFLLGIPAIHYLADVWKRKTAGKIVIAAAVLLFLSDNFSWIAEQTRRTATQPDEAYISNEQKEVLRYLAAHTDNRSLIVSADNTLPYLAMVYTSAYSWVSHVFTTPFVQQKKESMMRYMEQGIPDSSWKGRPVFFIFRKNDPLESARAASPGFVPATRKETGSFIILGTGKQ